MIQANELRVGNWINIQGNFKKVLGIDYLYKENLIISDFYYQLDWCEPIPITEEILLKCGFELFDNDAFVLYIKDKENIVWFRDTRHSNYEHLKHLHQLQNLYFALTNQELSIEV